MLVHLGCGLYKMSDFGNTCPSKTSESYSWILLEAGEERGFLMWLGFLLSLFVVWWFLVVFF